MLRLWPPVLRFPEALAYLHVRCQSRPQCGPGGDCNNQEPRDHPHDSSGYQKQNRHSADALEGETNLFVGHQPLNLIGSLWERFGQAN